ncbi:pyridoxal phosphate-dependent transferase [Xylogone sp. PMI_703]|nr:pyridoxal phosphate-dependent transferase [Xylogone sp. PMI_703]
MTFQSKPGIISAFQDTNKTNSAFSDLPEVPADEVFALITAFNVDSRTEKVNLGAGVYRTEESNPWPLPVVENVEEMLHSANDDTRHEYLSIAGEPVFLELGRNLAFGLTRSADLEGESEASRITSIQTVSGTGASNIGAIFLHKLQQHR